LCKLELIYRQYLSILFTAVTTQQTQLNFVEFIMFALFIFT